MREIKVAQVIDEPEILLRVQLGETSYDVYAPEDLPEKSYIQHLEAKADLLEIITKHTTFIQDDKGNHHAVPLTSPIEQAKMEAEMLAPTRRFVEASLRIDNLFCTPRSIMRIYSLIDEAVTAYYKSQVQEKAADEPKGKQKRPAIVSESTSKA